MAAGSDPTTQRRPDHPRATRPTRDDPTTQEPPGQPKTTPPPESKMADGRRPALAAPFFRRVADHIRVSTRTPGPVGGSPLASLIEWLARQPSRRLTLTGLVLLVLIAVADQHTGTYVSITVGYMLPVFLASAGGRRSGTILAGLSAIAWTVLEAELGQADQVMYGAKRHGRNTIRGINADAYAGPSAA
jgi:hypothetical protein